MESSPQLQTPQCPSFSLNHRGLGAPSFYIPRACSNQTLWGEGLPASLPAPDSCSLHLRSRCSSPGAGFKKHTHTHTHSPVGTHGSPIDSKGVSGKRLTVSQKRGSIFIQICPPTVDSPCSYLLSRTDKRQWGFYRIFNRHVWFWDAFRLLVLGAGVAISTPTCIKWTGGALENAELAFC